MRALKWRIKVIKLYLQRFAIQDNRRLGVVGVRSRPQAVLGIVIVIYYTLDEGVEVKVRGDVIHTLLQTQNNTCIECNMEIK